MGDFELILCLYRLIIATYSGMAGFFDQRRQQYLLLNNRDLLLYSSASHQPHNPTPPQTSSLSTIDNINLPRRVARHKQPTLLVKIQSNGAEAAVWAPANIAVFHDRDLGRLACHVVHGLAVLEVDACNAVAVGRVAVPFLFCVSQAMERRSHSRCLPLSLEGREHTSFHGKQCTRRCRSW